MTTSNSRLAFITNMCPHYRIQTFETLAGYHDVDFLFFSAGDEWYWQLQHGVQVGNFHCEYLPGVRIGGTRITPTLPLKLWHGHYDVYIKCINGRFALPITYLIAKLRRKPFILWTGIWMRLRTPMHRLFFPITRYIYRHADAVVAYGEHVKRFLEIEGVPAQKIFVAAHAVDNDLYRRPVSVQETVALREELSLNLEAKVVLYLGRLEKEKGLSVLLEAFASLQQDDTVLIIAGTGSERSNLEQLAMRYGITDCVRFPGYIPPTKTVAYYALAWVYVLPSVTTRVFKEPWGLVVNEAFNQGLPVVATDAVGAAAGGLVQDGINGYVVPERDSSSLAHALKRLLDDAALRLHMSQEAQRTIASWDNEHMVLGFRQAIDFVQR